MLFSAAYNIPISEDESWLDPILTTDTQLWIDPFLLSSCDEPEFDGADQDVFLHFRGLFTTLAADPAARISAQLYFPEVPQTGLGFTEAGTRGAGSGEHFATAIRRAMAHAIRAGLAEPRHFEEIGLLSPGLGPDRISDITTRLILSRLCAYTARVSRELEVPTQTFRLWEYKDGVRIAFNADLPVNPKSRLRDAVILVPKYLLRRLPTIARDGFIDYLWQYHAEDLRRDFNVAVKRDLAAQVLSIANANVAWVREYVEWEEERGPRPYPVDRDPDGRVRPYREAYRWASVQTVAAAEADSLDQVLEFVRFLIDHYRSFIEDQGGFRLLWSNDLTRHRGEKASQQVFQAVATAACELAGVDMSPETNAGVGPVDFKFSTGYDAKVLVELKHVDNSRYWDGPWAQLPAYMRSHRSRNGMFVALGFTDDEVNSDRYRGLNSVVADAATASGMGLGSAVVDARPQTTPASRRRRT